MQKLMYILAFLTPNIKHCDRISTMAITVKIHSNLPWLPLGINTKKLAAGETAVCRKPGITEDVTWNLTGIDDNRAMLTCSTTRLQADGMLASEPEIKKEITIGPEIDTFGPTGRPWTWEPRESIFRRR